jgi:signal transduction histidine kinase/DNA-binding response OmpR family regulator/ligand-binding sensor domain-containing protein
MPGVAQAIQKMVKNNKVYLGWQKMKSGLNLIPLFFSGRGLRSCLCALFIMHAVFVFSQSVREISTRDGLPQSFVSGLVQDDTSFIWIGTRNGLARYDGIHFKVFQHNPRDTSSLASNLIIWIKKDEQNKLWIEFESGAIDEMDPVSEKIRHFININPDSGRNLQFVRRGWLIDEDDMFWGINGGKGLENFNPRSKSVSFFTRQNTQLPGDTVMGLTEIKNKGIWILSQQGISLFDRKTHRFTHWPLPFKQDFGNFPGSETIAVDLHERKNGELMWGDRQRIFFFNTVTHSFRTVSLPSLAYLGIRWIRTSSDGMEYFENYGKVYRYDDKNGLTSIGKTLTEFFGDVKSFLVDRSGLIWLGTNAGGIHQIDLETPFFQSFKYKNDFLADMLLQELGVHMKELFNWTAGDEQYAQPGYHFRSAFDANRRLYMALKETVCYYDGHQNKIIKLPRVPLIADSEKLRIAIKGITINSDGSPMVIGYNGRIMFYDSVVHSWKSLLDSSMLKKRFGTSLLPLDMVADEKNIWISTQEDGLLSIDLRTKKIIQLKESETVGSLPANQLLGLEADPRNGELLWIGSYQGLISLNKKTLKCEVFSLKEGLPDNTIYAILPDAAGNLWLSTNKGICRFDPVTHKVRAFNTIHGLPGDEFNRFYQLELPDGRLTFGGTDGWTIFNPLLIKNDTFEPAVAFTDLMINNKEAALVKEKGFRPINELSQLTLPYEQNTLSFGFAGLEFSQPQDLQYRYRLEGYDNEWVQAGNKHQAVYTKIPPGNYTLLVNASNTSGKWSEHIRALKLRIESPWWSTRMAYLCYCIILAGLTWTLMRFRVSRIVMKEEMALKEREAVQLKEIDDMKSRFFSNITHEFRTPLTLIMGPAEQMKSIHTHDPQQSRLADTIVSNAKQLLVLINRLMDLSKLEAKALRLTEQRGSPSDTVGIIVHSFESDAATKQIRLAFEDHTEHLDCWFYADALERIVYNLVSNALKFTPAGGRVNIILSAENESLHLLVSDNGIGIAENKLPHIFDRFYQADENSSLAKEEWDSGTGIGLSLVKELVNQMHGKIEVESRDVSTPELSSGTLFTVHMPYRRIDTEEWIASSTDEQDELAEKQYEISDRVSQILLVEDNAELARFIMDVLSDQYQVIHALNGELGLESALSAMPDLILSDVMMPVMDGYELCRRIKDDIRTSHIPVILLTAKVSQENIIEGLTRGADDYLTKPFHPTELKLRIHNLLARQQKLRDLLRGELALPAAAPDALPVAQDIFITRLNAVLDEHLEDSYFGVDQLTGLVNMSRSSLHRKLKSLTGLSTTEFVRNYRLKRASLYLREGFSSSDAAYKTGFGSPAYFTKSFREVYGMTPGEFKSKA